MGRTIDIADSADHTRHGHLALLLVLYIVLLFPSLNQVSTYHSDERFYTDAAVYMINHHIWLTPYYPDGELRLNKPIVTYLALIISYAVLGVSYFASRFPFLLAGCATLWLTYEMAVALTGSRRQALLAAAILACNIEFVTSSLRATPDIVQALFLNLSLYGFIALIVHHDARLRNYIFAYFGAALAVETKGLLGFAPAAYAFLFNWLAAKKHGRGGRLVHLPVMALSILVAGAWYAAMYMQHGHGALGHFYQDQVGDRLSGPKYYILWNIKDYLVGVFRHFLPWSLILAAGMVFCRRRIQAHFRQHTTSTYFVLGWFALLLLVFIGGNTSRTRYLLPAYPLLAVSAASFLSAIWPEAPVRRLWRWVCAVTGGLMALAGTLLIFGGMALHWKLLAAGAALMAGAFWVLRATVKNRTAGSPIVIAFSIVLILACGHALVSPVFEFDPARKVAACVLQSPDVQPPVSVWLEKEHKFAGQLYSLSRGRIIGHRFDGAVAPGDLAGHRIMVLSQAAKASLDLSGYKVTPCGATRRSLSLDKMWRAYRTGGKDSLFKAIQEPLYLVRPLPG